MAEGRPLRGAALRSGGRFRRRLTPPVSCGGKYTTPPILCDGLFQRAFPLAQGLAQMWQALKEHGANK